LDIEESANRWVEQNGDPKKKRQHTKFKNGLKWSEGKTRSPLDGQCGEPREEETQPNKRRVPKRLKQKTHLSNQRHQARKDRASGQGKGREGVGAGGGKKKSTVCVTSLHPDPYGKQKQKKLVGEKRLREIRRKKTKG